MQAPVRNRRIGRSLAAGCGSTLVVRIEQFTDAGLTMLWWLTTVWPAVRVRPDRLVVDNLLRHVILRERFGGLLRTAAGILAPPDDGKQISCRAYGRSAMTHTMVLQHAGGTRES